MTTPEALEMALMALENEAGTAEVAEAQKKLKTLLEEEFEFLSLFDDRYE
jgi:hypothetical protein